MYHFLVFVMIFPPDPESERGMEYLGPFRGRIYGCPRPGMSAKSRKLIFFFISAFDLSFLFLG